MSSIPQFQSVGSQGGGGGVPVYPTASTPTTRAQAMFRNTARSFILFNTVEMPRSHQFAGRVIYFPTREQVALPDPRFPDKLISAFDPHTARYIPGTLVLIDLFALNSEGERVFIWNAEAAVKHFLGDDLISSPAARQGICLLPDMDPETVRLVEAEGRARWEAYEYDNAKQVLLDEADKEARYKRLGMQYVPSGPYVEEAILLMDTINKRKKARIEKLFGGVSPDIQQELRAAAAAQAEETKANQVQLGVRAEAEQVASSLFKQATADGTPLSSDPAEMKLQILKSILTDPETRAQLFQMAEEMTIAERKATPSPNASPRKFKKAAAVATRHPSAPDIKVPVAADAIPASALGAVEMDEDGAGDAVPEDAVDLGAEE